MHKAVRIGLLPHASAARRDAFVVLAEQASLRGGSSPAELRGACRRVDLAGMAGVVAACLACCREVQSSINGVRGISEVAHQTQTARPRPRKEWAEDPSPGEPGDDIACYSLCAMDVRCCNMRGLPCRRSQEARRRKGIQREIASLTTL